MFWLSYESFSILSDVFVKKKKSFPAENSCIPEKKKKEGGGRGGVKEILFKTPLKVFFFFYLTPWKLQTKKSSNIGNSTDCVIEDPLKIPRPKTKTLEIPHYFFFVTLRNSTLFLIKPWKLHMLFLWYTWKFHICAQLNCHPLDSWCRRKKFDERKQQMYIH